MMAAPSALSLLLFTLFCLTQGALSSALDTPFLSTEAAARIRELANPTIRVEANISSFSGAEAWTLLFVTNPNPTVGDWVALYAAGFDPKLRYPMKYLNLSTVGTYLQTGKASIDTQLLNFRVDLQFYFFQNGSQSPILAAKSAPITNLSPNDPYQPIVTLASDAYGQTLDNALRVRWISSSCSGREFVRFGPSPSSLTSSTPASCATYTPKDLCNAPANSSGWFEPGYIHIATLTHLGSGKRVYYSVGDPHSKMSEVYSVSAPPKIGDKSTTTRVLAFADYGKHDVDIFAEMFEQQGALNTTMSLNSVVDSADIALLVGDVAYALGWGFHWDQFGQQIRNFSTRIPLITAIGNHEMLAASSTEALYPGLNDSGGECGVPYQFRYPMPTTSFGRPWYSVDVGLIHFTFMSTEHPWNVGSEQYNFILADLASVNRTLTPWLVFAGHRPMYLSSWAGINDTIQWPPSSTDQGTARVLQLVFEPLFRKFNVDLVLVGHHHSYQRTCSIAWGNCTSDGSGTTHALIGNGGCGFSYTFQTPPPPFIEVAVFEYGFSRFEATWNTLTFTAHSNDQLRVIDTFTLSNSRYA